MYIKIYVFYISTYHMCLCKNEIPKSIQWCHIVYIDIDKPRFYSTNKSARPC